MECLWRIDETSVGVLGLPHHHPEASTSPPIHTESTLSYRDTSYFSVAGATVQAKNAPLLFSLPQLGPLLNATHLDIGGSFWGERGLIYLQDIQIPCY